MIFLDTNVISETLRKSPDPAVMDWLAMHDDSLAIPAITIAEIAFGIARIRPDERADRLQQGLDAWRSRFAGRIYAFTEQAAMAYGELMGDAYRAGFALSAPGGMIAATAIINQGRVATRNSKDFSTLSIELINPWQHRQDAR